MSEYAKLSSLKEGDTIVLDDGFTCRRAGEALVHRDGDGLYFLCKVGRHYLSGQLDEDNDSLSGITKKETTNV